MEERSGVNQNLVTFGLMIGVVCIFICLIQIMYIIMICKDIPHAIEGMTFDESVNREAAVRTMMTIISVVLTVYLTFVLVDMVSCLLLIAGIQKRKHLYMLPWLIVNAVSIVLKLVACVCLLALCAIALVQKPAKNLMFIILNSLLTAIGIAVWILIASLYANIKTEEENNEKDYDE